MVELGSAWENAYALYFNHNSISLPKFSATSLRAFAISDFFIFTIS